MIKKTTTMGKGVVSYMKRLKIIAVILIVVQLAAVLSGCLISQNSATEAFESMMDAFKACNENTISDYYSFSAVTNYVDDASGKEYRDAVLSTLGMMDYRVISSEVSNENAVIVTAEITTVDFAEIVDKYIDSVTELVNSKEYRLKVQSMTTEEYKKIMAEKMVDAISQSSGEKVTKQVNVTMIKSGKNWILGGEPEELLGVLFADISNAVSSLT